MGLTIKPVNPYTVDTNEREKEMNNDPQSTENNDDSRTPKKKMIFYATIFGGPLTPNGIDVSTEFDGEVITFQGKRDMDAWLTKNGVLPHKDHGMAAQKYGQLPDGRALLANQGYIQPLKVTVGT